jgi:uncharacterized membrane protein
MKNANLALLVIVVLLIAAALQLMHYYPLMPNPMARHFGMGMEADGWSPKQSFFTTYALVEVGMLIVLLVPIFLQRRIPVSMINMPNREYWFAPERHEQTWIQVSAFALWMSALMLAFLIVVAEATFRANLADTAVPRLDTGFFWALGAYLAAVAVITLRFYRRFLKIPRDPNTPPPPE